MEDVATYTGDEWNTYAGMLYGVGYTSKLDGHIHIDYTFNSQMHAAIMAEHLCEKNKPVKFQVIVLPVYRDIEAALRMEEQPRGSR